MNPLNKIDLKKDSFTKKEMIIYNILKENPDLILRGSISTLSNDYHVSQSTITRFCQKIGYEGFNDFKFDVFRYEKQDNKEDIPGKSKIDQYCSLFKIVEETLDQDKMKALANDIMKSETIIVMGSHKSALPGEMLRLNLLKFGKKVLFVPFDLIHDLNYFVNEKDMIIYFTNRGSSLPHYKSALKDIKNEKHCILSIITMNNKLSLKNYCDHFIWLPSSVNQHFDMYLENQIVFFLYVDLLVSQLSIE